MEGKKGFRGLFWPFALLLAFLGGMTMLSLQLASEMGPKLEKKISGHIQELISIALFAGLILLFGKKDFRKVFLGSLIFAALIFAGSCLLPISQVSYFFMTHFCPKMFPVLGWCYVNQIAKPEEGMKYYFGLIFIAGLIMVPAAAIAGICDGSRLRLLAEALISIGLILLLDFWVTKRRKHA